MRVRSGDHIETLHELDIEYSQHLAANVRRPLHPLLSIAYHLYVQAGVEMIRRCASLNDSPLFIKVISFPHASIVFRTVALV